MKRYPMAHKIIIPEGTHRVRLDHTDVAATIKRARKEQAAALGGPVPLKTLPALVAPEMQPAHQPFRRVK